MLAQEKQDNSDYIYIEKLKTKSERQLKVMLDTLEKETIKIQAEKAKLESKLKDKIKKGHFVKDALMEKWRTPSAELLEAMQELENGGGTLCKSMEEFDRQMAED
ncbi:hypothetical protein PIF23_001722 [Campylobacter jejuni]|nr:hypothetical protein [Campylobacter jejuni]EKJ1374659.1 hypothetical protein [Campylobacter jejuni]